MHNTTVLPRSILCGNHLGQMIHQQVRACATRFNAYTSHKGRCTHGRCRDEVETNRHVVAHCPRYADARAAFQCQAGLPLCGATYVDIMSLNHKKLKVAAEPLAKALCAFLAKVAREHARCNKTDRITPSVATPLDCNQRRSIIPASRLERAPD